jgi:ribosome-binding protein aMBF1 (putative translation factor)
MSKKNAAKQIWSDVWEAIGSHIKSRREQLNIKQSDLADKIGFSAQFLGRIEKGKSPLPEESFKKLNKVLKLEQKKIEKIYLDGTRLYLKTLF